MPSHSVKTPLFTLAALVMAVMIALPGAEASTRVGGQITEPTVWDRTGSPYTLYRDIHIKPGGSLTIEPGVNVLIKANIQDHEGDSGTFEILVEGHLEVRGTAEAPVFFQSTAVDPRWLDWAGIIVKENATANIKHATIHHASNGIYVYQGKVDLQSVNIENCDLAGLVVNRAFATLDNVSMGSIGNNSGSGKGLLVSSGEVEMKNSFIVGVQNGVTILKNGKATIRHSVISHCVSYGVWLGGAAIDVQFCSITGNNYGIILTGATEPVIKNNNLFENGVADIQVRKPTGDTVQNLDVSGNWWQFQDLVYIEERVIHSADDPSLNVYLNLEPFLPEAVSTDASRP